MNRKMPSTRKLIAINRYYNLVAKPSFQNRSTRLEIFKHSVAASSRDQIRYDNNLTRL